MNDGSRHWTSWRARYPWRPGQGIVVRALALLVVVLLVVGSAAAAGNKIKPNGRWKSFEVKAPGGHQAFLFQAKGGVRYRVTAEGKTLERPIVELYAGRSTAPDVTGRASADAPAVIDWLANEDKIAEIRLKGFSLTTGRGRVKLQPLDWDGNPVKRERRWLGPAKEAGYMVSELMLGEHDTWYVAAEAGCAYEVTSSQGEVARVRLRVLTADDTLLADSIDWWLPNESSRLRFAVPPAIEGQDPSPLRLEVEAIWPSAGSYGVRLTKLAGDDVLEAPTGVIETEAEATLVEGERLTFTLGEGDMAVLWIPEGNPMSQRAVFMKLRGTWVQVESDSGGRDLGHIARGRRPQHGNFQSFRPYQPGTYRFSSYGGRRAPAQTETLKLYTREELGPPPVHMGTASDPTTKARTSSAWKPVGLGICVPGITYLFVTIGAPNAGVGMRVRSLDGVTIATRAGGTSAPGYGPSMRFKVKEPMVVRLEARGGKRVVQALLRELKSEG